MHLSLRILLETITAAGTLCCLCFYALSFAGLISFLAYARKVSELDTRADVQLPPVSILKPLKGVDPEIWQSFCSHAEQEYPEFELIFGVSDVDDPACEVVRRLQSAYPACQIKLIVCQRILGTNVKVSNLAQMVAEARHEVLLLNDSDIRVAPDYLRQIIPPLSDAQVGLVTCLYRGIAAKTPGSRLESLGIATDFVPGILSARLLEGGLHFGLGSTLAFRRDDLASIGGFESIVDYLADDYELGRRISAMGKRVELSAAIVATYLPPYTLGEFWRHQLRWSRTIRDARRWGYAGLLFTFGLPWSLATLVVSRGATWAWILFAATLAARLVVGIRTASGALHDRQVLKDLVLIPLRDLIAPLIWFAGLIGNRIRWRGDDFYLKDGQLIKVDREVG
ncbi:MAG: bacteriohopanetetrol glucosamine biosynthesis glycosyltransferase HpnI [Terriglobales bacterium]